MNFLRWVFWILLGSHAVAASEQACIWEAGKDSARIWLVGSLHVLSREDYPLPPVIQAVYDRSERVVFELDPKTIDVPETRRLLWQLSSLQDSRPIWKVLDRENQAALMLYFELSGRNPEAYRHDRPWRVAVRLVGEEYERFGIVESESLESTLEKWAERDRKAVSGLESITDQYRVFHALSWPIELQLLKLTLQEIGDVEDDFVVLRRAWRQGDLETLEERFFSGRKDFPDLLQALYEDRNARWLSVIHGLQKPQGSVMLVVGVGHLLGPEGLPAMLSENGWTVKRVLSFTED